MPGSLGHYRQTLNESCHGNAVNDGRKLSTMLTASKLKRSFFCPVMFWIRLYK